MKIGQFSKKHDVTIDAIRHYIDLQLLVPLKQGGQYEFDEHCSNDLKDILLFKEMGFTLSEIKSLLLIKRYSKMSDLQNNEYYKSIFINKLESVKKQLQELNEIENLLVDKLDKLEHITNKPNFKIGIPLHVLPYLRCPKCQGTLSLSNGNIEDNQVMSGILKCSCDSVYEIKDGILMISDKFLLDHEIDEVAYVFETPITYLDSLYKGIEWVHKKIDFDNFHNKVIVDLGVGNGMFLRNIFSDIPEDCIYFAVDHDLRRMYTLKKILSNANHRKNIVLVCSDFFEMPFAKKSIDIVIDIYGTTAFCMRNTEFLLDKIGDYFKDNHYLYGSYSLFKTFAVDSLIPTMYRKFLVEQNILNYIKMLKYNVLDLSKLDTISDTDGGEHESFIRKGDRMYGVNIIAKK